MSQTADKHTKSLLNRVSRIRGQLDAVERAITANAECAAILQQATACRGALDGLITQVVEHHVREHVIDPKAKPGDPHNQAAEELIEIVHSFLK
jgi:DNA-binding FrmR family transcriptional regulator